MEHSTLALQAHTTLRPTAGLPLKLSRVGLDGRPEAAGCGVGEPIGGTLASGLSRSQGSEGDVSLCRVPSFGMGRDMGVLTLCGH